MKSKSTLKQYAPFVLLAVLLTGCQTETFTHKQFRERVARIHSVGLSPAQIHTAILNNLSGHDPSPAPLPEEQQIRLALTAATIDQLQRHGFVVKQGSPDFPTYGFTNQIWDARLQQVAINTYFHLPAGAARPEARILASNLDADGVIFLNVSAYKSTEHRQNATMPINLLGIMAAMCGSPGGPWIPWQQAVIQLTLVDGATGDILWMTAKDFHDFERHKPSKAIEKLFDRYPKHANSPAPKPSAP